MSSLGPSLQLTTLIDENYITKLVSLEQHLMKLNTEDEKSITKKIRSTNVEDDGKPPNN